MAGDGGWSERRPWIRGLCGWACGVAVGGLTLASPLAAQPMEPLSPAAGAASARVLETAPPESPEVWLQQAEEALRQRRFGDAVALYRRLLEASPENVEFARQLAQALAWQGDLEASIAVYREVQGRHPDNQDVRLGLARTLAWAKRYAESEQLYREVLSRSPDQQEARLGLAQLQSWQGDYDLALSSYRSLLEEHPGQLEARLGVARVLAWKGDYPEAIAQYRGLIQEDPQLAEAHYGLGEVYRWQGMTRDAWPAIERALQLDPEHQEARRALKELQRGRATEFSPLATTVLDSDNNQLQIYGADLGIWLEPQTQLRLSHRYFASANPDQNRSGRAELTSARLWNRVSPQWAWQATLGRVTLDPHQAAGQSQTVGGAGLSWTPHPNHQVGFGYGREVLVETAQLVENGIAMESLDFGYRWKLPGHTDLQVGYARSTFSDQNTRNAYSAAVTHRPLDGRQDLRLGVSFRHQDYARQTFNGYFSPPTFQVGEAFVDWEHRRPDSPWIGALGGAAGYQTIAGESSQFIYRLSAAVGYRFHEQAELELSGLTTTSAISSVQGFRYDAATLRATFRF